MARAVRGPAGARPAKAKAKQPAQLRDGAQALSGLALETLAAIMRGSGAEAVRLAAAREVLDRAHGKAKAGEAEPAPEGLTVVIRRFGDPDEPEGDEAA